MCAAGLASSPSLGSWARTPGTRPALGPGLASRLSVGSDIRPTWLRAGSGLARATSQGGVVGAPPPVEILVPDAARDLHPRHRGVPNWHQDRSFHPRRYVSP